MIIFGALAPVARFPGYRGSYPEYPARRSRSSRGRDRPPRSSRPLAASRTLQVEVGQVLEDALVRDLLQPPVGRKDPPALGGRRLAAGLSPIRRVIRGHATKLDIVQVQPLRRPAVNLYLVQFARVIPVQDDTGNALTRARIVDVLTRDLARIS